ncbi:amino acid ABC transporter permease [Treponema endosymbiont of Eucomonympha sp.]|uniref:amino acid ABC transporter permease n=1 Tax=Treponema endosymbiont of Eucomonympha sp. TaxID=1580831 RepID=UPI0007814C07|nr:amino acid ABC transporter permease [Treponema endosymbiont of Eucomonympha sp.]
MGLSFDPSFFLYELGVAVSYLPVVALLSGVPLLGGLALGTFFALCRVYRVPFWQKFAQGYVVVMRSVPMLLQMFLAYFFMKAVYGALSLSAADMDKTAIVTASLTLNAAGFLSEGVRSALLSVERGQQEAGESVGLTQMQIIRCLVLPQCLPVAVPVVGQGFISIIKGSAAAYLLGVIEMIQGTAMKTAGNYRYLEAYCATAIIYWGLTMLVERLTFALERKVRRHAG